VASDLTTVLLAETEAGLRLSRRQLKRLTEDEFWWEPAPNCWTVRRTGSEVPGALPPLGEWAIDGLFTYPDPSPVTTIGWRLNHMTIVMLGYYDIFGTAPEDIVVEGSAEAAIRAWEVLAGSLTSAVREMSAERAAEDVEIEHWGRSVPRWTIVGHILREQIHHSAEIGVLRDLHRVRS
jgi:hypothetical protein